MTESLRAALKQLRLSGLLESLEVRLHEAAGHGLNHSEFLELVLQDELAVRADRQLQRRVKAAQFRELKTLEDWGKLIGDVPSATAILDRFLHHAEVVAITGKSYRLRNQSAKTKEGAEECQPVATIVGAERGRSAAKPANAPIGSAGGS